MRKNVATQDDNHSLITIQESLIDLSNMTDDTIQEAFNITLDGEKFNISEMFEEGIKMELDLTKIKI